MDLPEIEIGHDYIPIPPELHSFEIDGPFQKCATCSRDLLDDGTQYLIEKAFNRGETIFEYAMCFPCRAQIQGELSQGSLKMVEHYFDERTDFVARRKSLLEDGSHDHRPWLSHCILSGEEIPADSEYQIYGHCDGPDLLFTYMPYAISGKEIEGLLQCLSKKTRDRMDEFVDDVLGIPGGHVDLPVFL